MLLRSLTPEIVAIRFGDNVLIDKERYLLVHFILTLISRSRRDIY